MILIYSCLLYVIDFGIALIRLYLWNFYRIGFSIAKRLAQEGAKVMISSRRESNVKKAVEELQCEGLEVAGTVCHVGKEEDRKNLFDKVDQSDTMIYLHIQISFQHANS